MSTTTYDDTCRCADCQSYSNHVENSSSCSGSELPSAECKNDSFHQTSVLYSTQSDHFKLSLLPTKWPSFPHSLLTPNGPQCNPQEYTVKRNKLSASTGRIPQMSSLDERASVRSQSCLALIPHCTCQAQANGPIVYVTFAESSKRHENKVVELCRLCEGAGFTVKCDSYRVLQESGELNVNQWRDENFRRAACVLFCISPAYIGLIKNLEEPQAVAEENDHSKGAVYIYNLARAELVDSCCLNKRFFCVLFTKPGVNLTAPPCFTPYSKFRFPGESQTLIKAMQARHSPNQELH